MPTYASEWVGFRVQSCDLGTWQIEPVACWQYSWQALSAISVLLTAIACALAVLALALLINDIIDRRTSQQFSYPPHEPAPRTPRQPVPYDVRQAVLARASGHCEDCGSTLKRLELHHLTYRRDGYAIFGRDGPVISPPCLVIVIMPDTSTGMADFGRTHRRWPHIGTSGASNRLTHIN